MWIATGLDIFFGSVQNSTSILFANEPSLADAWDIFENHPALAPIAVPARTNEGMFGPRSCSVNVYLEDGWHKFVISIAEIPGAL